MAKLEFKIAEDPPKKLAGNWWTTVLLVIGLGVLALSALHETGGDGDRYTRADYYNDRYNDRR